MDDSGNLIFAKLMSSDEGRYQCSAQNVVATRETAAVLLSVHGKSIEKKKEEIVDWKKIDERVPPNTHIQN